MLIPCHKKTKSAFVLIVILFTVLLLALLVVGLFVTSGNLTRYSSLSLAEWDTDLASDMALNLVQSQIKEATSHGIAGDGTATETWASQPGAIRTYDTTGTLTAIYKLYSSDTMKTSSKNFITDGTDIPDDWKSRPDAFVDLNEPVFRHNRWLYPIAHPDSLNSVEGFTSSLTDASDTAWDDRLVMPVRWIYISKDGSLSTDPSKGDLVARMAFWTDDESCKINVNTASATNSESYWDTPRGTLSEDVRTFALKQPAQNEYSRYPGHPATVSLSVIFPDLHNEGNAWLHQLIDTTPRYQWGGSKNGTVTIGSTRDPILNTKQNRIYATMDEYLYAPDRSTQIDLNEETLEHSRFFLTAASRSSELNLFGQPRVTIWPISASNDDLHRTAFDQLIARCSTIGEVGSQREYYFTRTDPLSQTNDWNTHNQEIFAYLRDLTSRQIPGFGGNFQNKYDETSGGVAGERDQILIEIFDSIRTANLNETLSNIPSGYQGYTTMLRDEGNAQAFTRAGGDQNLYAGAGFVLPIKTPYGRGAGRVPVVSEVGLWFIRTVPPSPAPVPPPAVQTGIIVETNTPSQGMIPWQPYQRSVKIGPSPNGPLPLINGIPLLTGSTPVSNYGPSAGLPASQSVGGTNGWAWLSNAINTFGTNPLFTRTEDAIPAPDSKIHITAGEIEVQMIAAGIAYQTFRVQIPAATLDIPDPVEAVPITAGNTSGREGWIKRHSVSNYPPEFYPEDVVQSIALRDGDARVAAYLQNVPSGFFAPHRNFGLERFAHGFRTGFGVLENGATNGHIVNVLYGSRPQSGSLPSGRRSIVTYAALPDIPDGITSLRDAGWDGDFDNGVGGVIDGAYIGKPDEGAYNWRESSNEANEPPYYGSLWKLGDGLFSPLRQMPSAVVFGSLPTGVKRTEAAYDQGNFSAAAPWRTLAFSPNPSNPNHFGIKQAPPDHLLLDLFTMPCVEPYAISEPFSIAGRLNMNYSIVPFTHIHRSTPIRAALASQKLIAIPNSAAGQYKTQLTTATDQITTRLPIDADKTLAQWEEKFSNGDIFRSASEICEQFLVPEGASLADVQSTWWNDYQLTGDNSRERPYATLYPLLTTRSSTYTLHFRVQAVKRLPNGNLTVLAEKRGSQLFERYLDPNNTHIGKGKIDPHHVSLEPYFRFRTLLTKRFDP